MGLFKRSSCEGKGPVAHREEDKQGGTTGLMTGGPVAQAGPSTPTTTATQFYPLPPPNTMAPYSLHGIPTNPYFRQNYYSFFNTSIIHPQAQASMASHGIYVTLDRDVPQQFELPPASFCCHFTRSSC